MISRRCAINLQKSKPWTSIEELNACYVEALQGHPLCAHKTFVPGEGQTQHPRVMLVGEAPGRQEAQQGRPFVGQAGKQLDHFLAAAGIARAQLYTTNTVKIRPTRPGSGARQANRPPSKEEVALFLPWLEDEIRFIVPQAIVTLGNTPLRALAGPQAGIGACHGQWIRLPNGMDLYALYHPAAIIYNRSLAEVYAQDMARLSAQIINTPREV